MIGTETLWENLLLYQDLQSQNLHNLLDTLRHEAKQAENSHVFLSAHLASFHSKLLLSTILSDLAACAVVKEAASNIWLKAHGFTRTFSLTWKNYIELIHRHDLRLHLKNTLTHSPVFLCRFIIDGLYSTFRDGRCSKDCISVLLTIVTVVTDRLREEDEWDTAVLPAIIAHLYSHAAHLTTQDTNTLISLYFRTSHFIYFTGCKVFKKNDGNFCTLSEMLSSSDPLPCFDDEIGRSLHEELGVECCSYYVEDDTTCRMFNKISPVQKSLNTFVESTIFNSITLDSLTKVSKFVAVARYILRNKQRSDQYKSGYIKSLELKLASIPESLYEKIKYTSVYKTLNFDPSSANWSELINQIKYDLDSSNESFNAIIGMSSSLSSDKINDIIELADMMDASQTAVIFNNFIEISNVNANLIKKVTKCFSKKQDCTLITSFIDNLYNRQNFGRKCFSCICPDLIGSILGKDNTITKTINQLGMKGTESWKMSLTKNLLLHFLLDTSTTVDTIFRVGSQNKALCLPIANIIKNHLPFLLAEDRASFDIDTCWEEIEASLSLPIHIFTVLRQVLMSIKLVKDVKLFAEFLKALTPTLPTCTIIKQILIPGLKDSSYSDILMLNLLQHILQSCPFFNFTVFTTVLKLWCDRSNKLVIGFIDENNILEMLIKNLKCEDEKVFLYKTIEDSFECRARLRVKSIDDDIPVVIHIDKFLNLSFSDAHKLPCRSLREVVIYTTVVIMNKSDPPQFYKHLLQDELPNLKIRSKREWQKCLMFLEQCLQSGYIDLPCLVDDVASLLPDIQSALYTYHDCQTVIFCAILRGNVDLLPWFALFLNDLKEGSNNLNPEKLNNKDCESEDNDIHSTTFAERFFLQCCILMNKVGFSKRLESLIMSVTSHVSRGATFTLGLEMLPDNLKTTLCSSENLKI